MMLRFIISILLLVILAQCEGSESLGAGIASGPAKTRLLSPEDHSEQSAPLSLHWREVEGAESYQVVLSSTETFSSPLVDDITDSTRLEIETLPGNTTIRWKVRSIYPDRNGPWSDVFTFTTAKAADTTDSAPPGGPVKIMPLGDSITEASGYRVPLWNKLTNKGYAIDYVGSQSDPHPGLPDTDHEGHGGWYISHIADKVDGWLATYQPDYVLLMIGTNDVAWWSARTGAEIADAHAALVDQILAHAPSGTWVLAASIPPQSSKIIEAIDMDRAQLVRDFNAEMEKRMQQRIDNGKRIVFVDMHSRLTLDNLRDDGVHPNDQGYEIIAQTWFENLLPVLP